MQRKVTEISDLLALGAEIFFSPSMLMQWGLQIHASGIYKVIQHMQIGKLCLTEGENSV